MPDCCISTRTRWGRERDLEQLMLTKCDLKDSLKKKSYRRTGRWPTCRHQSLCRFVGNTNSTYSQILRSQIYIHKIAMSQLLQLDNLRFSNVLILIQYIYSRLLARVFLFFVRHYSQNETAATAYLINMWYKWAKKTSRNLEWYGNERPFKIFT